MKLYCQECFAKIEYKFSKPKFCPECGKQIGLSKFIGPTSSASIQIVQKSKDEQKIKDLESELEELKGKNKLLKSKTNLTRVVLSDSQDEQDEDFDNEEEEEDVENYAQTQKVLSAFKRGKFKTGVTVEKNTNNSGISFKDLMDGVSSGSVSAGDDFKMTDNGVKKTDQQILEELRIEASSKPRVIQID